MNVRVGLATQNRRIIAPLFVRLSELDNVLNHEFAWIRINLTKSSTAHPVHCAALCAVVGGATIVLATASIDQLGSDIDGEAEGDYFRSFNVVVV